jgi:TRAP-type C4-dicarboxylate transport system permease small subunit
MEPDRRKGGRPDCTRELIERVSGRPAGRPVVSTSKGIVVKRFDAALSVIGEKSALVCGYMLIAAALYVSAELISRKAFGFSLGGANEVSGYVLGATTAWSFGYTMLMRSHIRIDVFTRNLPPRGRAVTDLVGAFALVVFAAVFVWHAVAYLDFLWQRGTRSITSLALPLWIPVSAWCAGWIFFLVVSLNLAAIGTRAFLRGDHDEVQRRIGAIMEEEDLIVPLGDEVITARGEQSR